MTTTALKKMALPEVAIVAAVICSGSVSPSRTLTRYLLRK